MSESSTNSAGTSPSAAVAPVAISTIAGRFADVLGLIRQRFGVDLTLYKAATVERRLERRMLLRHIDTLEAYLALINADPDELAALHRDMLLTVTSFFRDGAPFEALRLDVIPRLLDQHGPNDELRIWVPACATGQEAYSIAICVLEALEARGGAQAFQVFATDAEEGSVAFARRGRYPESLSEEVSPERLARFFTRVGANYEVTARVRERVVFSRHDVLSDAPFSRLDLVSCRNLLIYLRPDAQLKVLRRLHFSLLPHGALLLGASETVGEAGLFSQIDRENKVYLKKPVSAGPWALGHRPPIRDERAIVPQRPAPTLAGLVDRLLLDTLVPPAVVVDSELDVVLFRGKTGPYIEPASGSPSFQLLRVTPLELHAELRRIAAAALEQQVPASGRGRVTRDGATETVLLNAQPLVVPGVDARFAVISFEPAPSQPTPATSGEQLGELERELANTRRYLRDSLDDHQQTTEDLCAANEQLQSSNEELQSTNEELTVSREELQSMNDELVSVNDILRSRMDELTQVNDDLRHVMVSVEHAVLIFGARQELLRFNHVAAAALDLREEDVGSSLLLLDRLLGRPLETLMSELSRTRVPVDLEVLVQGKRWHAARVSTHVGPDGAPLGAVVTLVDVDAQRRARELGVLLEKHVADGLAALPQPLLVLDASLRVHWANGPWYRRFKLAPEEVVGASLIALDGEWAQPALLDGLTAAARGARVAPLKLDVSVDGRVMQVEVRASRLSAPPAAVLLLVSVEVGG